MHFICIFAICRAQAEQTQSLPLSRAALLQPGLLLLSRALSALSLRSLPLSIGLVVKSFSHYNLSLLLLLLLLSFCGFWLHPKTYNNNDDGSSSNYIVYAVIERQANKTLSSLALPLPLPLSCSLVLALVFGSFAAKSRIGKLVLVFGRAKCMTF